MVEEEEEEKFDYGRCDCYCVVGRDEKGTGGWREERQQGQRAGEKTIFFLTPHLVISPEDVGVSLAEEGLLVVGNVSGARCSFIPPSLQLPSQQQTEKPGQFPHANLEW